MKNSLTAILFLILISPGNLGAQKYIKVIDATSTPWSGGMARNGSGVRYAVKAVLLTDQKVTFTDIWIGREYGVPEAVSFSYADGRTLKKGDTIMIKYSTHTYPPDSPLNQVPKPAYKNPPYPLKGAALFGFTIGNKTRYTAVESFRSLPAQKYM